MGYAMEDMFVALNAADWATPRHSKQTARKPQACKNRKAQLLAQVEELIGLYSLNRLLGGSTPQAGMLMDALCLAVKQLLGLQGCWLLNGTMLMGSSQSRGEHHALLGTLASHQGDTLPPDHPVWKALQQSGVAFGYVVECPLFKQTGGQLILRSARPLSKPLVTGFAQVISANIQLQHQLWQITDALPHATEAELQHYRTELTEWVLTLLERQTHLVQTLSQFIGQRNGLTSNHPLRVAALCHQLAQHLGWDEEQTEAIALAGFQSTLEGIQWSNHLQDGHRTWQLTDRQQAIAQASAGWLMLSQFFPLIDWPAQTWDANSQPARLLAMAREYCALTETRHYRRVTKSARQREQALQKLADKDYPEPWLIALVQLANTANPL
jgi:hypothetical protein